MTVSIKHPNTVAKTACDKEKQNVLLETQQMAKTRLLSVENQGVTFLDFLLLPSNGFILLFI